VIQRERLFRRLDQARHRPVIWISGPAGSGKTTLASSYIEARALPCLWYQVDAGDADLATFFYYLGLAGKKASPRSRRPLPALTPEYLLGVPEFSRNFFESLCRRVGSPATLVFDNCQLVEEDASIYVALLAGLNRLPEDTTLVLLSRADPPACFARLRANRELTLIGWEDLRLTFEEFEELALGQGAEGPAVEDLPTLHRRADGWVAGLQLLLESSRTQGVAPREIAKGAPQLLFDYFAHETFNGLEEERRDFLLQTSVLPNMTPRLADALTGGSRSARILAALHRRNYFTERRPGPELSYQYHPLFREFLAERASARFGDEDLAALRRRAAQLLLDEGRADAAAALFRQAKDWEGMTGLILAHAPALMKQGRNQVLGDWIRSLPAERVEAHPGLQLWLGSSHMPMNPPEAYACFQRTFRLFRESGDVGGSLLAWSGAVDSIVWGFANFHELKRWTHRLAELIPGPEALPPGQDGARVAASMYAALITSQPAHPDLPLWERAALAATRDSGDPIARMQTLFHVHTTACYRCDPSMLERTIAAIRREIQPGSPPFARIIAAYSETLRAFNLCHYEEGLRTTEEGLQLASTTGVRVFDYQMMGFAVHAALTLGRRQLARQYHERMGEILASMPLWDQSFYHYLGARFALDEGDLSRAGPAMQLALEQVQELGHAYPIAISHLVLAFIAHEAGDEATAEHRLELARKVARENHIFAVLAGCLATEAHILLSRGEEKAGLEVLRRALSSVARRAIPYYIRRDAVVALFSRALATGIETEFVVEVIRRLDLPPPPDAQWDAEWPWPLRIHSLGHFELLRGGEPLRAAGKAQRKPLELLQLLIALGGEEVAETRLSEVLWPDADGDMAHRSFATNLHRLRRLLGVDGAIEHREGRVSLNARRCWVDVWAVERLLDGGEADWRASEISGRARSERAEELTRKALDLYRGPFLEDLNEEGWPLPLRERLRSRLMRGIEALGQHLERARRWEDAVACYERALEVDPHVESFYRRLMVCLAELGRLAEALATYDRCRELLGKVFGVEPSPETEMLRKELGRGHRPRMTSR
jgi:DNA-binding SARP family transcriptional activator